MPSLKVLPVKGVTDEQVVELESAVRAEVRDWTEQLVCGLIQLLMVILQLGAGKVQRTVSHDV